MPFTVRAAFSNVKISQLDSEGAMYSPTVKAVKSVCGEDGCPSVLDTHASIYFPADISVSDHVDGGMLLYGLRWFLELKRPKDDTDASKPKPALLTAETGGQMVDYFSQVQAKQPHRMEFTAVLSDYETYVFLAKFRAGRLYSLIYTPAPTLAQAVATAHRLSSQLGQYSPLPSLPEELATLPAEVIGTNKRHVVFSSDTQPSSK